ncbi:MAG: 16S rRNA (cytidine(1402)-2'-O)-methyltransferase [Proteobacteria bacterium]|nr:16S rRNA (cytidine(1402)-2'-O)-methyltransferase [Pseudomonadota bacterium]
MNPPAEAIPPAEGAARGFTVQPGWLYLVATPIGNLEDITLRAVRVLREVDVIAAEDTRKAQALLAHLGIGGRPTLSLFEGNEAARVPGLIERLRAGQSVAVISEAGMPGISDPGWLLRRACLDQGLPCDVIPGASAVTTALLLSGLPPARFRFVGFLPRKGPGRRAALQTIAASGDTTVLFEARRRTAATLTELAPLLGTRTVALLREMTKRHQQVLRGSASELLETLAEVSERGEVTLVIAGAEPTLTGHDDAAVNAAGAAAAAPAPTLAERVAGELERGASPRQIARTLAAQGQSKREVYQLALRLAQAGTGAGTETDPDTVTGSGADRGEP